MAIDASIPLQYRPPRAPDPMEAMAQTLSLRDMIQRGRMGQEQLQAAQFANRKAAEDEVRLSQFRQALARGASAQELMQISPELAAQVAKQQQDAEKTRIENQRNQIANRQALMDYQAKMQQQLAGPVMQVYLTPREQRQAAYNAMLPRLQAMHQQALKDGIPAEVLGELPTQVPDDQSLEAMAFFGLSPEKRAEMLRQAAAEQRAAETHAATLPGQQADSEVKQFGLAERTMPVAEKDQPADQVAAAWMAWRGALPKSLQARVPETYSPEAAQRVADMAMSRNERVAAEQASARIDAEAEQRAETQRHNRTMESRAGNLRGMDPRLVQTVLANPELYDQLPAGTKAEIAPDLAQAGWTGFGKPLSESAITKMADIRSAIQSLQDLREVLKANERYIGPAAGWSARLPWSEARKAQADIDRVKQRVGKTLEGGVLRKEDEEKYKRILSTVTDEPSTAIYKVDSMIQQLQNDLDIFVEEQRNAGRRVGTPRVAGTMALPTADKTAARKKFRYNAATDSLEEIR